MFRIKLELKLNNKEKTKMLQNTGFSSFVFNYDLALMHNINHQEIKRSSRKKTDTIKKLFTNYTFFMVFSWCKNLISR